MRFKQIVETTTAGSVATVAQPMMTQTRENVNVPGLKPVQQLMKGKSKKKGPYANSIVESKVTEDDLDGDAAQSSLGLKVNKSCRKAYLQV